MVILRILEDAFMTSLSRLKSYLAGNGDCIKKVRGNI